MERRNANYNLLKSLKAFEPVAGELLENTCGNIQDQFNPTYYREKNPGIFGNGVAFYDAVSAPMLLARLCKVYQATGLENEGEANAKLIAAAPEMLQALKNIISSAPITCLPLALEKDIQAACILIERLGTK